MAAKQSNKDLMKLDFYEILDIRIDSEEKEIKKSYRKKALKCHPDKNPDNPDAAVEFDRLKKILEILLDPGARKAYDRVLKARKAAAIRAREVDSKTRKLKSDLEERERQAQERPTISEEERFRRELKRLEEEGKRIIEEELERLNKEVAAELNKGSSYVVPENKAESSNTVGYKVKVKWVVDDDNPGYTEKEVHQLFYKWGEINALVIKQKTKKGTALIEFKEKSGADMAVQFEKGLIKRPVEVEHIVTETKAVPKEVKEKPKTYAEKSREANPTDYESIAQMNSRREQERKRLIAEILERESKQ